MCQLLSNDTVTARKQHACSWCGQKIEAGSKYVRQFVLFDGDTCTNKFHPECDNWIHVENVDEFEGDESRPTPPDSFDAAIDQAITARKG